MFGYIVVNKQELKFREFDVYQSYYCGLCKGLLEKYGRTGQMTLSFDMTFLLMVLSSLYEPKTSSGCRRCVAHPLHRHFYRENQFTEYIADMNLLLSYEKSMDDWKDEHKFRGLAFAKLLEGKNRKLFLKYPEKTEKFSRCMEEIHQCEQRQETDVDKISGIFGELMGELFVYQKDAWEHDLRRMGFFLGKFIYLMDAYEDIENDLKNGNYNPFLPIYKEENFEAQAEQILLMMMTECSRAFEKLPIVENIEILRNILYSGVWTRYEMVKQKRKESTEKQ